MEIKEALERIEGYIENDSLFGDYEKDALPTLLKEVKEIQTRWKIYSYTKEAVSFLRAWTRSTWEDFVKESPSPLMNNTKKWLENYDRVIKRKD